MSLMSRFTNVEVQEGWNQPAQQPVCACPKFRDPSKTDKAKKVEKEMVKQKGQEKIKKEKKGKKMKSKGDAMMSMKRKILSDTGLQWTMTMTKPRGPQSSKKESMNIVKELNSHMAKAGHLAHTQKEAERKEGHSTHTQTRETMIKNLTVKAKLT